MNGYVPPLWRKAVGSSSIMVMAQSNADTVRSQNGLPNSGLRSRQ